MSDPYEWDGKEVHFCLRAGQSAQDADMACGLRLSTWAGANARSNDSTEDRVGYTFEKCRKVTCASCRVWMEANLKKCDGCGVVCCYGTCAACLPYCICGAVLWDRADMRKHERHANDCPGRILMPADHPTRQRLRQP